MQGDYHLTQDKFPRQQLTSLSDQTAFLTSFLLRLEVYFRQFLPVGHAGSPASFQNATNFVFLSVLQGVVSPNIEVHGEWLR